jgi:hypothetical protein
MRREFAFGFRVDDGQRIGRKPTPHHGDYLDLWLTAFWIAPHQG